LLKATIQLNTNIGAAVLTLLILAGEANQKAFIRPAHLSFFILRFIECKHPTLDNKKSPAFSSKAFLLSG